MKTPLDFAYRPRVRTAVLRISAGYGWGLVSRGFLSRAAVLGGVVWVLLVLCRVHSDDGSFVLVVGAVIFGSDNRFFRSQ
jgi:hypothetical protein